MIQPYQRVKTNSYRKYNPQMYYSSRITLSPLESTEPYFAPPPPPPPNTKPGYGPVSWASLPQFLYVSTAIGMQDQPNSCLWVHWSVQQLPNQLGDVNSSRPRPHGFWKMFGRETMNTFGMAQCIEYEQTVHFKLSHLARDSLRTRPNQANPINSFIPFHGCVCYSSPKLSMCRLYHCLAD